MDDFVYGFMFLFTSFLCLFVGMFLGKLPDYPYIPKYHEIISKNFGNVVLIEDSNHVKYYLFFEDGKEVKIKKQ